MWTEVFGDDAEVGAGSSEFDLLHQQVCHRALVIADSARPRSFRSSASRQSFRKERPSTTVTIVSSRATSESE